MQLKRFENAVEYYERVKPFQVAHEAEHNVMLGICSALLQTDIYAWDAKANAWEKEPIATTDRMVFGKGKVWQHTLTLLAEPGSARAKAWERKALLPQGKYLVKVYVDAEGKAKQDWKAKLGESEYVGQVEV